MGGQVCLLHGYRNSGPAKKKAVHLSSPEGDREPGKVIGQICFWKPPQWREEKVIGGEASRQRAVPKGEEGGWTRAERRRWTERGLGSEGAGLDWMWGRGRRSPCLWLHHGRPARSEMPMRHTGRRDWQAQMLQRGPRWQPRPGRVQTKEVTEDLGEAGAKMRGV